MRLTDDPAACLLKIERGLFELAETWQARELIVYQAWGMGVAGITST